jgi:hypothetical protein
MAKIDFDVFTPALHSAKNGDTHAARELAAVAAQYLAPGCTEPMPESVRRWLHDGLLAIAKTDATPEGNVDALRALFLVHFKVNESGELVNVKSKASQRRNYEIIEAVNDSELPKNKKPRGVYYDVGEQLELKPNLIESVYTEVRRSGLPKHEKRGGAYYRVGELLNLPPSLVESIYTKVCNSDLPWHQNPGGVYYEVGRLYHLSASDIESIYAQWRNARKEERELWLMEIAAEVHHSELPKHKELGGSYYEAALRRGLTPDYVEAVYTEWLSAHEAHDEATQKT